jgi:tripartite-type tricarboxylate transporter receptor subunit TctC
MTSRREMIKALGALGASVLLSGATRNASAQGFPTRTVRITTPFPAGSGPDAAARVVADQVTRRWGESVIVDNKPGGNGFIAVAAFKQRSNDGHDLVLLDSNHTTTHPHTFANLPYNVERDFVPIAMILRTGFFVVVGADSPFKSVDDIVQAARARPGRVTYGSWFIGSPGHIGALCLQAMKGIEMTHIPFRDFGQLYGAVASGEVDWALGSIASAGSLERAGKVRFIAFAAPARDPQYPAVPATAESPSLRGYEVNAWAGLFGPQGVPLAVRDRIASDVAESLAAPEVVERYKVLGYEAPKLGPDEFAQLMRRETVAWGDIIRSVNLRLD